MHIKIKYFREDFGPMPISSVNTKSERWAYMNYIALKHCEAPDGYVKLFDEHDNQLPDDYLERDEETYAAYLELYNSGRDFEEV